MSERWHYQLNGFELGPVPATEILRLVRKGRLAADTPVRPEGEGAWSTAELLGGRDREAARSPIAEPSSAPIAPSRDDRWHERFLDRVGPFGVPVGVALTLPWDRPAWSVGALVHATIAGAWIRLLVGAARDLGAIRRAIVGEGVPGRSSPDLGEGET